MVNLGARRNVDEFDQRKSPWPLTLGILYAKHVHIVYMVLVLRAQHALSQDALRDAPAATDSDQ